MKYKQEEKKSGSCWLLSQYLHWKYEESIQEVQRQSLIAMIFTECGTIDGFVDWVRSWK